MAKNNIHEDRFAILYIDEWLAIINKPSGLLSVPYEGCRTKTALSMLEATMRKRGIYSKGHRPFAVHRLDRDTSGVLMFALQSPAQKKIMNTWHTMVKERLYRAVGENPHSKNSTKSLNHTGFIDVPLAQNKYHQSYVPKEQKKMRERNKLETVPARTHYTIIEKGARYTLFELSLDTGKKNQIRAHLAYIGYPLAGDPNYRARTNPFKRLALHARSLVFIHPYTNEELSFEVKEPAQWYKTVKR